MRPHALRRVLTHQPIIGMAGAPHAIVVGRGAELVGEPEKGEESGEVASVPLDTVHELIGKGEILSSGTLVALPHIVAFGFDQNEAG